MLADPGPTGLVAQALRWKDNTGSTALRFFASSGSYGQVANLVQAGDDRDALDANGRSPLYLAAMGGALKAGAAAGHTSNHQHVRSP
jgi:ankyrin repeat protein